MSQKNQDTVLAKLRAARAKLEANRTVDIEIPGWSGLLFARYKQLSYEDWRPLTAAERGPQSPTEELVTAWDTLIAACECIMIANDEGELEPLGDGKVRFDSRLADLLPLASGSDDDPVIPETPHEIVAAVFPNEPSVIGQRDQYIYWLANGEAMIKAELGKASETTDESA